MYPSVLDEPAGFLTHSPNIYTNQEAWIENNQKMELDPPTRERAVKTSATIVSNRNGAMILILNPPSILASLINMSK